jgi:hypothetical protein
LLPAVSSCQDVPCLQLALLVSVLEEFDPCAIVSRGTFFFAFFKGCDKKVNAGTVHQLP